MEATCKCEECPGYSSHQPTGHLALEGPSASEMKILGCKKG